jgi:hypothetical protein
MMHRCLTRVGRNASTQTMVRRVLSCVAVLAVTGCVTLKAPDKPIEINLNINVKQEVVVSLKKDAEDFITNNPDLFPK